MRMKNRGGGDKGGEYRGYELKNRKSVRSLEGIGGVNGLIAWRIGGVNAKD